MNINQLKQAIAILKQNPKYLLGLLFVICLFCLFILSVFSSLYRFVKKSTPLSLSETKQIDLQRQSDQDFSKTLEESQNKYPWYENLPPKNSKYFVAFDQGEQTFHVSLYSGGNAALAEEYKKQLFLDLEKIGVSTQSYNFNYIERQPIR